MNKEIGVNMSETEAFTLLIQHRNNVCSYSYEDRKSAMAALKHLVLEWVQCVDGSWQLIKIGYH